MNGSSGPTPRLDASAGAAPDQAAAPRAPGAFVWPPRGDRDIDGPRPRSADAVVVETPSPTTMTESWWTRVERAWLDPVAEPLARRAARAGWAPDEPARYCDRCGHDIGVFERSEFGCSSCRNTRPPWDRFVRLGRYETPLSDWVCEVKFTRFRVLGLQLGRLLGVALREAGVLEWRGAGGVAVVAMPTTWRRRFSRGIDHAGVIARGAARELGVPVVRVIARRHRPSQRSVAVSDRPGNVSGAFFGVRRPRDGTRLILVDDVMTTGATLRGACRGLRKENPGSGNSGGMGEVWVGVLSVAGSEPARQGV
ncbi:MAG: phosphoribosyltransferase family protein [Planctomycetota bacterium]|nr:phosphoribosyltransferase family protein [Planctomycetota bacterium]